MKSRWSRFYKMNQGEEAVKFGGLFLFLPGTSLGGLGWQGDPKIGSLDWEMWRKQKGPAVVASLGLPQGCVKEESCRPHGVSKVD